MKKSKYNIVHRKDDAILVYNSLSGALAKVDDTFFYALDAISQNNIEKINNVNTELLDNMKRLGLILDDTKDELEILKKNSKSNSQSVGHLKLIVAPTLECNFKCVYCYEEPKKGFMKDEVIEDLLSLLNNAFSTSEIETLSLVWYGGEPLLAPDIIEKISLNIQEICKKHAVKFHSSIITNGYLVNEKTVELFIKCKINSAQITLDGLEDTHEIRRCIIAKEQKSFHQVVDGIQLLTNNDISVNLRINVDRENYGEVNELMTFISNREVNKNRLKFSLGHVFADDEVNKDYKCNCLSKEEFSDLKIDFLEVAHNLGFKKSVKSLYPKYKPNYCSAPGVNTYVVDPEGGLYKCWNDICDLQKRVGVLNGIGSYHELLDCSRNSDWGKFSIYKYDECVECAFLPVCAGGCPRKIINNESSPTCEDVKFNINSLIEFYYEKRVF